MLSRANNVIPLWRQLWRPFFEDPKLLESPTHKKN